MKSKTVLIVEDDEILLDLMADRLKRHFNVLRAKSGNEALERIRCNSIDCAVLDIELPDINGIEVLKRIRGQDESLPVLIATGKSCLEYAEQCADCGVRAYITKPFKMVELIQRVNALFCSVKNEEDFLQHEGIRHPKLRKAVAYISMNYSGPVSMERLAHNLDVSSGYLSTLFKKELGVAFARYLNDFRVGKAKTLLKNEDIGLAEVMARAGFKTEQHFFKEFKRSEGMTPNAYRHS